MYKYKILEADSLINEHQLNELARDGWKLVTIIKEKDIFYFYFEKNENVKIAYLK